MKKLEYYLNEPDTFFQKLYDERNGVKQGKIGNVRLRIYTKDENTTSDIDLRTFNNFRSEEDMDRYLDYYLERTHKSFEAHRGIEDGFFPNLGTNIGIGDFSAFVAGDITFTKDTSWTTPVMSELSDYKKLPQIKTSKWYKRYMILLEKLLMRVQDLGIPFNRGYYSPFDLAEALVGSRIYMDFYDDPEGVKELLDYCADVLIVFMDDVTALIRRYLGNSKHGLFFVDGLTNMSEDIATNISPDLYKEFCRPATQKVIDHFGQSLMHTHSTAMYLIDPICSMDGVVNMWLPTDPNAPVPIEMLEELLVTSHKVPCSINADSYQVVEEHIDQLLLGNFEIALYIEDKQEAILTAKKFNQLLKSKKIAS